MEIKVTHLIDEDCTQWSDSRSNSGRDDIGQVTWRNAVESAAEAPLVTAEQQDELRSWIRDFGAWTDEDIAAMSDVDTNALLLQSIAGDIQEMESFDSYREYERAQCDGQCSGRLFKALETGRAPAWYFYVGN